MRPALRAGLSGGSSLGQRPATLFIAKFLPEAMYTESAFRREELEGSGGEKQPEEGMESAEFLRNICEKDVTFFWTAQCGRYDFTHCCASFPAFLHALRFI